MTSYQLDFPAAVSADAVAAILRSIAAEPRGRSTKPRPPIVFETHLRRDRVEWWVGFDGRRGRGLMAAAERELPGLVWTKAEPPSFGVQRAVELRVDSQERRLEADLAEAAAAHLLGVTGSLGEAEIICIQWLLGSWLPRSAVPPATKTEPRTIWNLPEWGAPVRDSEQVSALRKKQAEHIFGAVGRVAVAGAASDSRARQLLGLTLGAYQLLRAPSVGVSRRRLPSWWVQRHINRPRVSQIGPPVRAAASELAGLIGWPIGNPALPGVRYALAPRRPFDPRLLRQARTGDRVFGISGYPAQAVDKQRRVVQPIADGLRHQHWVGPSGTGKSTLMAHQILADIEAGRGVVAIDPKGDLITDVMVRLPESRRESVVVLDPTDTAPVGFNPLTGPDASLGVDGIVHVLHSIWAGSWGPRLGDVLGSGLRTLAATPGHSLAELPLLLTNPAFRRPLVTNAVRDDPLGMGTFWPWFDGLSDDMRAQVLAPVMNKLRAFVGRSTIRAVLGQPTPRFDLAEVFTEQRALLVRLPKGQLGEGTELIGSLLVSHLWRLAQSRAAVPAARRRPVFIYLDEVQDFLRLPLDLADALVQARGLGVGLVMAHQHLEQLDRPVRSAVLANAGSRVFFRLDRDDAIVLAQRTGGDLSADNLSGLAAYEAYASLLVDGEHTAYGSLSTLPVPRATAAPATVLRSNRERWGVPAADTERRIRTLLDGGATAPTSVLGGRPNQGPKS